MIERDYMLKIYVAGPLSTGDYSTIVHNVKEAIDHADSILLLGGYPYLPHLTHFWNLFHSHGWDEWMALDKQYLRICDGLLRLRGPSRGADQEVAWAKEFGIPVYYTMEEVEHAIHQARLKAAAPASILSAS